jgi:hypothetical protein
MFDIFPHSVLKSLACIGFLFLAMLKRDSVMFSIVESIADILFFGTPS